ncbi:MAG: alpha-2-macroglobulin family protein [Myxococcota bacterium]
MSLLSACGADEGIGGSAPTVDIPPATGPTTPVPGNPPSPERPEPRTDFRETVYVNPSLITDSQGRAEVEVGLAGSITTWRVSADVSTAAGQIGSARHEVRTFQPFFVDLTIPPDLTTGDELEVPAIVYNYLESEQEVTISLEESAWFESLGPLYETVSIGPSQVRSVKFRIRVLAAGEHEIQLYGDGGEISDGLVRSVAVTPGGEPRDESRSGRLRGTAQHTVSIPETAIPGGTEVSVSLTPGFAAEVVEGLDSMLREPTGCFEQTTASAWPNTLVARYLASSGQQTAESEERSQGLVVRGYQRLLTFESPTGGFNWWGNSEPGNRILSAIMLWHLKDMESLITVDEAVRERTLQWLRRTQQSDGSWDPGDALHAGNEALGTDRTRSTAFIAWALAHTGWADEAVRRANDWLALQTVPDNDVYAVALVANALAIERPFAVETSRWIDALHRLRQDGEAGTSWPTESPSWTGARGEAGLLEVTGLAAYALYNAAAYPDAWDGAMEFILGRKDSLGTWYSTQATMNALRAIGAAAESRDPISGQLDIFVDGVFAEQVIIEDAEVAQRIDLTSVVRDQSTVELTFTGTGALPYRLTRRAYFPPEPGEGMPLDLQVDYDRTDVAVGEPVQVNATATNNDSSVRNQVMVRIGRAPGFLPNPGDLEGLVTSGAVSRYETRARDVTFYLMNLQPGERRRLSFRLTPNLAVSATADAPIIYPYYEPELGRRGVPTRFEVR